MATARITALSPGASPPPVLMAMRRMGLSTAVPGAFLPRLTVGILCPAA